MLYQTSWDLSRYFYAWLDDPKLDEDIRNILPATIEFENTYSSIFHTFTTPGEIEKFYHDYTNLSHKIATPSYYLFYRSSLDTQDLQITKKMWEVDFIYNEASNHLLFIAQWWKKIGYDTIMKWANDPLLLKYKNDLLSTADGIKYILGEREEYILNLKSRPLGLANSLHDELTGSYEFIMNIYGEQKNLTEEEVRSYRQHPDRTIRREAYASLRRVYNTKQAQITLGNIYTSIVKDWTSEIKMRGYSENVMAQRNMSEEMEDSVVDMLLMEVQKAYPLYNRFLKAKAKLLWLENDFSVWDVSAPLGSTDKDFTFEEAFDLHLSVMKDFDSDFYDYSREMIEQWRIDVFPRSGKRWWAFASYRKWEKSFVLLNFTGKLRDVSTISHELGHAIHGHLSQAQEAPVYDSPLSLAETASIFSEMLLGERVKTLVSKEEYKEYLNERLSDIFATIFRQVQYIIFERKVHEQIYQWNELTYKDLNILWRGEQSILYGNSLIYDVDETEESWWSMIPHIFHTPFYCYAYAFWNILTFALYNSVKKGKISVEDYKNILRAGGSVRPKELLMQYWIDISKPEFYTSWLSEIEVMVTEFENI